MKIHLLYKNVPDKLICSRTFCKFICVVDLYFPIPKYLKNINIYSNRYLKCILEAKMHLQPNHYPKVYNHIIIQATV